MHGSIDVCVIKVAKKREWRDAGGYTDFFFKQRSTKKAKEQRNTNKMNSGKRGELNETKDRQKEGHQQYMCCRI